MPNLQKFMTPAQLSARWGGAFAIQTLANWRSIGKGPVFVTANNRVLYPIPGVEKWEAENFKPSNDNDTPKVEG